MKIALIRNASNREPAACAYASLLLHLQAFDTPAIQTFRQSPFMSRIHGLFVTMFPLHQLCCLLNENWLEEDVFNALLEIAYFRRAHRMQSGSIETPDTVLLPTSFLSDALRVHASDNPTYTPEMRDFRRCITETPVRVVAIPLVSENHFKVFIYRRGSPTIEYGDSLHHTPPQDILAIIRWIFQDTCDVPITGIKAGVIAQQGPGYGDGSCGIAALNFIEAAADIRSILRPWCGSESQLFRDAALEDLLNMHHIAKQCEGTFMDWTTRVLPQESRYTLLSMVETCGGYGYNDYTVYTLLDSHPISRLEQLEHSKLRLHVEPKISHTRVPYIEDLQSVPLNHGLLPAFNLTNGTSSGTPGSLSMFPTPQSFPQPAPQPPISPLRPSHKRLQSTDTIMITSSPVYINTSYSTSKSHVKFENKSPIIIDLCTPNTTRKPIKLEPTIDLCSPLETPKLNGQPIKSEITVKPEADIINLCTPPRNPSFKKAKLLHLSESPVIEHIRRRVVEAAPGIIRVGSIHESLDAAKEAIYQQEQRIGHVWRIGQSRKDGNSQVKKVIFRCNRYAEPKPVHSIKIDPSDYRKGKSGQPGCMAHVNVTCIPHSSQWNISLVDLEHNHPPVGGPIRRRPTVEQKKIVSQLATSSSQKFSRGQIGAVLNAQTGKSLEPRQIGNLMGATRREVHAEVESLGGDIHAIIASLQEKAQESHGWRYHLKLDENSVATAIWWQSPQQ
ncbi:hypothetical protein DXG01_007639, partial [Tephrocybe rancida]